MRVEQSSAGETFLLTSGAWLGSRGELPLPLPHIPVHLFSPPPRALPAGHILFFISPAQHSSDSLKKFCSPSFCVSLEPRKCLGHSQPSKQAVRSPRIWSVEPGQDPPKHRFHSNGFSLSLPPPHCPSLFLSLFHSPWL